MQLSLNWLKDFVDIPKSITPEELAVHLTMHTVEVEGIKNEAEKFKNVVVGKILEIKKHPNADRLRLAKVDVGKEKLDIVCGAPNIEVGQLVPVALVGAVLPNGMTIKEAEVRGEKSSGMLCAADELGLGEDHSGIIILDNKKAKIGQDFADYLGLKDVVLEVDNKSLSNRPDLWGHYGIAREISAFLGVKFKEYKIKSPNPLYAKGAISAKKFPPAPFNKGGELKVKIEDFSLCPRYMAIAVEGIKIEQSPLWLQDRLSAVGMRPINNIVDITNYVMLEFGQPMHAFDAELLGNEILVRVAVKGETMETLDGEKRNLSENDILITDGKKPVAIAGIMGAANSEIRDETKAIVLESANFNYVSVRKTSTRLGLRTESSMRFEKGLDPNLCETALIRAVELIKKVCPSASVAGKLIDQKKFKLNQGPAEINFAWLKNFIGIDMADAKILKIISSLGFDSKKIKGGVKVIIPSWRSTRDISIKEDVAEEVARIYGYGNIKSVMPKIEMGQPETNRERILERKVKRILAGAPALTEVYNYSFVGEETLRKLNIDPSSHIKLANPISAPESLLRQSLAVNMFGNIRNNQANFSRIAIFETGSVFFSYVGDIPKDETGKSFLPYQEKRLAIAYSEAGADVFRKVKGITDYLFSSLGLEANYEISENKPGWSDENVCANIAVNKKIIGNIAKLSSACAGNLNIKKPAVLAEINFKKLFSLAEAAGIKKHKAMEKYPPAVRDLAFVVGSEILYNDIRREIINHDELIKEVELFDIYQGEKLGEYKKSLAFHIVYQADRTLTAEEVDGVQGKLAKVLEKKLNARVRDF